MYFFVFIHTVFASRQAKSHDIDQVVPSITTNNIALYSVSDVSAAQNTGIYAILRYFEHAASSKHVQK